MVDEFMKTNEAALNNKAKIDFDFLYALMKPTLLNYKALYEVLLTLSYSLSPIDKHGQRRLR